MKTYKDIYNFVLINSHKDTFFSSTEISESLKKPKRVKDSGYDELHAEALIFSHVRLHVLLSLVI